MERRFDPVIWKPDLNRIVKMGEVHTSMMIIISIFTKDRRRLGLERPLLLTVLAAVLLLAGCMNGGATEAPSLEATPTNPQAPNEPQIEAIEVMLDMPGASWQITITDTQQLSSIIAGIHEAPVIQEADQVRAEDEAGVVTTYRMRVLSAGEAQHYKLIDLRQTARIDAAALLQHIEDTGEAQATPMLGLPTAWIGMLMGDRQGEALLKVEPHLDEKGVTVYANRQLQEASVVAAVERSLQQTGWLDHAPPEYVLAWSDPQRAVIRLAELPGRPVLLHFGSLLTAEGERFANANQLPAVEASLGTSTMMNRLSWITPAQQQEDSIGIQNTVLVQPMYSGAGEAEADEWLLYHADGSQTRMTRDGEQQRIRITEWPGNRGTYGNDYGVEVLFSDRQVGDITYAVYGNRTLYRVNIATGKAVKLQDFDKPIYAVASSPDGKRIAVLESADDNLGAVANLLVLNKDGQELYKHDNAAYMNKSDGFLFPYAMSWIDPSSIAVLDQREAYGAAVIEVDRKEARAMEGAVPEETYRQLQGLLPEGLGIMYVVAQPQGRYAALQTENGWVWMYDTTEHQLAAYGYGLPLGWDEAGDTLAVARADSKYGLPYSIGVAHAAERH